MIGDWSEDIYNGYAVHYRIAELTEGDFDRWVAEVVEGNTNIFRLRLTVTRSHLIASREGRARLLKLEGLKRVHARLDFGEFVVGQMYEHKISGYSEELSHPFVHNARDQFDSEDEYVKFRVLHILLNVLNRPPWTRDVNYDLLAWAYYLNVLEEKLQLLLQRLSSEHAIDILWTSDSNEMDGQAKLSSIKLTSQGLKLLEELNRSLISRRREMVMSDLEDDAFQVARYLYENKHVGANLIIVGDLKQILGMPDHAFDAADNFLLGAGYCGATAGGNKGRRWLKPEGIIFVRRKLDERVEISADAENLLRYLFRALAVNTRSWIADDQSVEELGWVYSRYKDAAQELIDEGYVEDRVQGITGALKQLTLTTVGRRIVRRNFRRIAPLVNVNSGDSYNIDAKDVNNLNFAAGNSIAIQNNIASEIHQAFQPLYEQIASLPDDKREHVKDTVELIEEEAKKGDDASEKTLKVHLRNLAKMAPDIFEVVVAMAANPILGWATVFKQIAAKAKEEAQSAS